MDVAFSVRARLVQIARVHLFENLVVKSQEIPGRRFPHPLDPRFRLQYKKLAVERSFPDDLIQPSLLLVV